MRQRTHTYRFQINKQKYTENKIKLIRNSIELTSLLLKLKS